MSPPQQFGTKPADKISTVGEKYDGTVRALADDSHQPHSHPNRHTKEELNWIQNYHQYNLNIIMCELYGKLRQKKYIAATPVQYTVYLSN